MGRRISGGPADGVRFVVRVVRFVGQLEQPIEDGSDSTGRLRCAHVGRAVARLAPLPNAFVALGGVATPVAGKGPPYASEHQGCLPQRELQGGR